MASSRPVLFVGLHSISFNCSTCPDPCLDPLCLPAPPAVHVTTPVEIQHKSTLLPGFLIAAAALLAVSFLLFLTFYSVLRFRRRRRLQLPSPADPNVGPTPDTEEEVTHHVWLIRTVGLDDSAIASIAAFAYSGRSGGGDCTVCLGEFKDGEMVKLLPKCSHAFHASCVDTWLRSHVSCPLCRAPVTMETDQAADTETDPERNIPSSSSPSVVPVRRSVSMDAASLASLLEKADPSKKQIELSTVIASNEKGKEKVGCVAMKRSQSTRSGRFFFTRYGRGRSSSVLPL